LACCRARFYSCWSSPTRGEQRQQQRQFSRGLRAPPHHAGQCSIPSHHRGTGAQIRGLSLCFTQSHPVNKIRRDLANRHASGRIAGVFANLFHWCHRCEVFRAEALQGRGYGPGEYGTIPVDTVRSRFYPVRRGVFFLSF
jgi:hypothetical protein